MSASGFLVLDSGSASSSIVANSDEEADAAGSPFVVLHSAAQVDHHGRSLPTAIRVGGVSPVDWPSSLDDTTTHALQPVDTTAVFFDPDSQRADSILQGAGLWPLGNVGGGTTATQLLPGIANSPAASSSSPALVTRSVVPVRWSRGPGTSSGGGANSSADGWGHVTAAAAATDAGDPLPSPPLRIGQEAAGGGPGAAATAAPSASSPAHGAGSSTRASTNVDAAVSALTMSRSRSGACQGGFAGSGQQKQQEQLEQQKQQEQLEEVNLRKGQEEKEGEALSGDSAEGDGSDDGGAIGLLGGLDEDTLRSIPPALMQMLLQLEEERDELAGRLLESDAELSALRASYQQLSQSHASSQTWLNQLLTQQLEIHERRQQQLRRRRAAQQLAAPVAPVDVEDVTGEVEVEEVTGEVELDREDREEVPLAAAGSRLRGGAGGVLAAPAAAAAGPVSGADLALLGCGSGGEVGGGVQEAAREQQVASTLALLPSQRLLPAAAAVEAETEAGFAQAERSGSGVEREQVVSQHCNEALFLRSESNGVGASGVAGSGASGAAAKRSAASAVASASGSSSGSGSDDETANVRGGEAHRDGSGTVANDGGGCIDAGSSIAVAVDAPATAAAAQVELQPPARLAVQVQTVMQDGPAAAAQVADDGPMGWSIVSALDEDREEREMGGQKEEEEDEQECSQEEATPFMATGEVETGGLRRRRQPQQKQQEQQQTTTTTTTEEEEQVQQQVQDGQRHRNEDATTPRRPPGRPGKRAAAEVGVGGWGFLADVRFPGLSAPLPFPALAVALMTLSVLLLLLTTGGILLKRATASAPPPSRGIVAGHPAPEIPPPQIPAPRAPPLSEPPARSRKAPRAGPVGAAAAATPTANAAAAAAVTVAMAAAGVEVLPGQSLCLLGAAASARVGPAVNPPVPELCTVSFDYAECRHIDQDGGGSTGSGLGAAAAAAAATATVMSAATAAVTVSLGSGPAPQRGEVIVMAAGEGRRAERGAEAGNGAGIAIGATSTAPTASSRAGDTACMGGATAAATAAAAAWVAPPPPPSSAAFVAVTGAQEAPPHQPACAKLQRLGEAFCFHGGKKPSLGTVSEHGNSKTGQDRQCRSKAKEEQSMATTATGHGRSDGRQQRGDGDRGRGGSRSRGAAHPLEADHQDEDQALEHGIASQPLVTGVAEDEELPEALGAAHKAITLASRLCADTGLANLTAQLQQRLAGALAEAADVTTIHLGVSYSGGAAAVEAALANASSCLSWQAQRAEEEASTAACRRRCSPRARLLAALRGMGVPVSFLERQPDWLDLDLDSILDLNLDLDLDAWLRSAKKPVMDWLAAAAAAAADGGHGAAWESAWQAARDGSATAAAMGARVARAAADAAKAAAAAATEAASEAVRRGLGGGELGNGHWADLTRAGQQVGAEVRRMAAAVAGAAAERAARGSKAWTGMGAAHSASSSSSSSSSSSHSSTLENMMALLRQAYKQQWKVMGCGCGSGGVATASAKSSTTFSKPCVRGFEALLQAARQAATAADSVSYGDCYDSNEDDDPWVSGQRQQQRRRQRHDGNCQRQSREGDMCDSKRDGGRNGRKTGAGGSRCRRSEEDRVLAAVPAVVRRFRDDVNELAAAVSAVRDRCEGTAGGVMTYLEQQQLQLQRRH
ncbi:hypothetical protein VOLCADRAFT_89944 [Volvox carteri f. nagariensis]|uniref:Uncharacterized protein n=1 Tax=Volvox carteri f. nagariensis TaxID=3068 RepID=D8TT28_VOLCA|nr:uncharacterized protein VOLCADRAFT_89944 [Volvox carteri f. nagariensis]EFJ49584.1 hypothetical protein VOLCADRAFT_89944 [Volvox carteri f. nagariensis]|eukprot:XP_002949565.1 hypothetical protein VOLCADRAFT_89944 [Volvox carteri f. nagariensis]